MGKSHVTPDENIVPGKGAPRIEKVSYYIHGWETTITHKHTHTHTHTHTFAL